MVKRVSSQVKGLVPVWVQRAFADARRLRLLAIDGGDGERVGEAYGCQSMGNLLGRNGHATYGRHLFCRERRRQELGWCQYRWLASVERRGDIGRRTGYAEVGLSACTVSVSKTCYHEMAAGAERIEPHRKQGTHTQQPARNLMRSS